MALVSPIREIVDLPGKLIVLEGSDGVGRSTQTQLLRHWLEDELRRLRYRLAPVWPDPKGALMKPKMVTHSAGSP